jgi:hypothetical protein
MRIADLQARQPTIELTRVKPNPSNTELNERRFYEAGCPRLALNCLFGGLKASCVPSGTSDLFISPLMLPNLQTHPLF